MPGTTRPAAAAALAVALIVASSFRAPADGPPTPIPPARVTLGPADTTTLATVLAAIDRQTGIKVAAGAADPSLVVGLGTVKDKPFWDVLGDLATLTKTRIAVGKQGRHISFAAPTGARAVASTDGPFRIAAREVAARTDLATGRTVYDLTLDIHWEPRFPVFRVDSLPKITAGTDDLGNRLTAKPAEVKSQVSGYAHATVVRLDGLVRKSGKVATLSGTFAVTASPRMLAVRFDALGELPVERQQDGVTVKLARFAREDDRWEAEFELAYPPGQPEFESFESWASGNALKLVAPGTGRVYTPDTFDLAESSRRVRATYRFRTADGRGPNIADRAGWQLVYETPAPLVEFPVRFELKDIPLP